MADLFSVGQTIWSEIEDTKQCQDIKLIPHEVHLRMSSYLSR
jgi:hypothetical protein